MPLMVRQQGYRTKTIHHIAAAAMWPIAMLALAGCGSEPIADTYLAEYVPFSTNGVDTDIIFPRDEGASRFLIRNWPPMQTLEGDTLWIHGKWARIGFFSVADIPPTLVAEARPYSHPDAPRQRLTVFLNGVEIESLRMLTRWETYEFKLPVELVKVGWNEIELRFSQSLRPADFDPESLDRRTLAAEFRRVEIRGGARRPYWPERPEQVSLRIPAAAVTVVVSDTDQDADRPPPPHLPDTVIEMPTDSFFDFYLSPGEHLELLGAVDADLAFPGEEGTIRTVIEVIEPERTIRIWEAELGRDATTATVRVALDPWAGRVIGLRIRVFGSVNGIVRWAGLALTGSGSPGDAVAQPARVVAPPRSGAIGRPDIFIILLDAARADVFEGSLGAELAPNVQALARDGTTFTRAWAPSSWTGQSVPALFSGMTPDAIGIQHWGSRIPPQITTFPELLHDAGYRTILWSQHNIYRARPPLRRGFEVFEEVESSVLENRVILPAVSDLVVDDRPTFAMIHLLPPHTPYLPPPPFSGPRSGWYSNEMPIRARLLNGFERWVPQENVELRDDIRRAARDMYEENVQFADHLVGRFVDDLKQHGRYDDALIIVLSDHGEGFYEHGRFLHLRSVYEELLRVPLIIKWPRSFSGFPASVATAVSLIDIAPTLVDGLAIEDDRARYQGRSLLPTVRGEAPPNRILLASTSGQSDPDNTPRPRYALLWNDLKLIYNARSDETELYRLSDDPGETVDLSLQEPFYVSWLQQTLRLTQAHNAGFLLRTGGAQIEELDADTIRNLRALGYLR